MTMKKIYRYSFFILLFTFISFEMLGQLATVQGIVRDKDDNEPLSLVNIIVKDESGKIDTKNSTVSTVDGEFSIQVPLPGTVDFSFIGYNTVTRRITSDEKDLVIFLTEETSILDDVVVVAFRPQQRGSVTAAVQVVETEDLVQTPVANALELLQGRVPGLNVQVTSGLPGGVPSFTMRGISDISISQQGDDFLLGSSMPLFVVDGIPQEDIDPTSDIDQAGLLSGATVSPLSMVPFEDIQRMEILKDAAATSLYGSRGAYGVILITTKRGSGPPRVSYSSNYVVRTPPRLRDVSVGSSERDMRIMQILQNDTSRFNGHNEIHDFPVLSDSLNPYWNNNTDWQGRFYGVTHNQTHNLSFSGGSNEFSYKVNGNYYTEEGIVKNTDFNRYGIRTGLNYNPKGKFSMDVNISATVALNSMGSGNAFSQAGVAKGSAASSLLPPPSMFISSTDALAVFSVNDHNVNTSYDANVGVNYKLPYDVDFNGRFGYRYNSTERERFTPGVLSNNEAEWYNTSNNSTNLYAQTLFYRAQSFSIFRLGLQTGVELSSWKGSGNTINVRGAASDHILSPGIRPSRSEGSASFSESENTLSFIFNPTFNVGTPSIRGEKYVINPNIRPEANSTYGKKVKWTVSPSLSFRWNFSREKFADNWGDWFGEGSLRASWGRTTRYRATRYDIWGTYLLGTDTYNGIPVTPIDFNLLPNDDLKPVTSTQWNLGTDLSFFNNRLRFMGELYYRQTDNQLSDLGLADHNAFNQVRSTGTSIVNYGTEILIHGQPLSPQSDWRLDLSLSIAINRDILAKLPDNARQIINNDAMMVNRLGSNALANYLYVNNGVYARDEDVPVNPATGERMKVATNNNSSYLYLQAGDPIWVDINGDYIIDSRDKVVIGNSQPRVTGGFNVNLRYKSFSVNSNFSFTLKRDILNKALGDRFNAYSSPLDRNLYDKGALTPIDAYEFWRPDRIEAKYSNPFDYIRGGTDGNKVNFFRPDQTLFMEDGSYFKMNGISMGYTLPERVLSYFGVGRVQLNASANNIYTFSKYSGVNPENVNGLGHDTSGGYPNSRSYTVGIIVDF